MWENHFQMKTQKLAIIFCLFPLLACQSIQTKHTEKSQAQVPDHSKTPPALLPEPPKESSSVVTAPITLNEEAAISPVSDHQDEEKLKIGIVLGPGAMRSFAHIGVLQEFVKAKINIHSLVGIEMGALVGGIFSNKGQTYDVEWQMMKLHENDFFKKGFIAGGKPQEITVLQTFLKNSLAAGRSEDSKVQFACPSFNLKKRQTFMMNRGAFTSMLPFCLPYAPMYKPFQQNIAGVTSVLNSAKYLKSKGANYLIYVDLLNEKSIPFFQEIESDENVAWSMVAQANDSQLSVFNKVIPVSLGGFYLNDFEKRRDMIQRGQDAGRQAISEILSEKR